jgi:hypothetical protein
MAALLALPPEILHNVLKAVDPQDLATLPRCCRALQTFISGNRQLFKELYLQRLASPTDKASLSQLISAQDEPPRSVKDAEPDWEQGLHTLVSLQTILASYRDEKKGLIAMACNGDSDLNILKYKTHFRFAARAVVEFLQTAAPSQSSLNVELLSRLSEDERNREFLFCNSELFLRSRGSGYAGLSIERQLSAKLHCLYGVPIESTGRTRSSRTYPYACSKVYDLRNYTDNTIWGPFLDDGSLYVDWEKIEAIMIVIGHNLRTLSERTRNGIYESIWSKPFASAVPDSYVSLSVPRIDETTPPPDVLDPFNVTGTYMRVRTPLQSKIFPC